MFVRRSVALLAALSIIAVSCGGDSGSSGGTTTAPTTTAAAGGTTTTAAPTDPTEVFTDVVARFSFGTPAGSNYDPHIAFNQFANIFLYPAYDRLTDLTREGEVIPMLAESWEFSADGRTLVMKLRQGVVFHDGTPFNADAVKANLERGKTHERSAVKADLASLDTVAVIDDHTVELRLSSPGGSLPALLSDRAGMMISPAAFDNENLDLFPVGAGAFKVVDHTPGSVITFERFDDYWDPSKQALAGLEIQMQLDPQARLRAVQDGQVDGTTLNPDQIEAAQRAGLDVQTLPTLGTFGVYLNKTKPGLSDPKVREALSLAIDRAGIASAIHYDRCTPTAQLFPAGYWANEPSVQADPFDPARARELLAEAGFADSLALDAVVVNVPFYVSQVEALQAMFADVGVALTITALEPTALLSRFTSGDSDVYYTLFPGTVDPAKTVASLLSAASSLNPGGYTNADVDKFALEGLAGTSIEERTPSYRALSAAAAADRFHIPVCNTEAVFVGNSVFADLEATLGGSYDFRGLTPR